MPNLPTLLFIPGLHRLTTAPARASVPQSHPFCPSRHALVTPPVPSPPARFTPPPRGRRIPPPPTVVATPISSSIRLTIPTLSPEYRPGHKHTAESKRKISVANRGNVPWNKGLKHSEETKRKISEATRRAMLKPQMRQMLKERAKGRRHSEATKLKIRETARAARGIAKQKKPKKTPVPFDFTSHVVAQLNEKVQDTLNAEFQKSVNEPSKLVARERGPMPMKTREKLSQRIKEMWSDPDYRMRVAEGIEQRQMKLARLNQDNGIRSNHREEDGDSQNSTVGNKAPKRRARPSTKIEGISINSTDDGGLGKVGGAYEGVLYEGADKSEQESSFTKTEALEEGELAERYNEVAKDKYLERVNDDEGFLRFESLDGLAKGDMGLFSSDRPGGADFEIEAGPVFNDERSQRQDEPSNAFESQPRKILSDEWESTENLLRSLRDAGQLPPLDGEPFVGTITRGPNQSEYVATPIDTMREPHAELSNDVRKSLGEEVDELGFLQGPVDLLSSSMADLPSPFFSVPPVSENNRIASRLPSVLDLSGNSDLAQGPDEDGFLPDKFSLNFVDDNFGDLGIYDDVGHSLGSSMKPSSVVGFDDPFGSFAKTTGKSQ